ncbi:Uncharacterised protein [uncultured archaeon]|nr:Uncharacterised protein [uncultured archaeon]
MGEPAAFVTLTSAPEITPPLELSTYPETHDGSSPPPKAEPCPSSIGGEGRLESFVNVSPERL